MVRSYLGDNWQPPRREQLERVARLGARDYHRRGVGLTHHGSAAELDLGGASHGTTGSRRGRLAPGLLVVLGVSASGYGVGTRVVDLEIIRVRMKIGDTQT